MEELMLSIENVSKMYRLGQIGGTTLMEELQRRHARRRGLEDPTKKIGAKDYNKGETFLALDGVSIKVRKGERIGIIGHNGAGKSTLLKLISRVTAPTGGIIYLNGRVASMLEVGTGFHRELTGRENIYMNGAILGMKKKEIDAKIEKIIEFSECRQFIDTPVKRYSSGMYVKLAFSVAAHLDSEIIIMDEVLAVGDMAFQQKCLTKMKEVSESEDRTILYVSHNMNTIRELCDRCIVLNHGKVIFDGSTEDGIDLYLNGLGGDSNSCFVDLSSFKHTYHRNYHNVNLKSIELIGRGKPKVYQGEKLSIDLVSDTLETTDACIAVSLSSLDGAKIATSYSDPVHFEGNHVRNRIVLDISTLREGQYLMSVGVCYTNWTEVPFYADYVARVISFAVEENQNRTEVYKWRTRDQGFFQLPKLEVSKLGE